MAEVFGFLFYRGIERWMVVLGGLIFGYLGYKLFLYGVDQGHGKLDAENKLFKIAFSGSGPGLFFMAFGALILMSSVYSTGTVTQRTLLGDQVQSAGETTNASGNAVTSETTLKFTAKVGVSECDLIRLSGHNNVRDSLEAYGNVGNAKLEALASAMNPISDEALVSLLPAIETLICE